MIIALTMRVCESLRKYVIGETPSDQSFRMVRTDLWCSDAARDL